MKYIKFLTLLLAIFISLNMAYAQERKDMNKSSETIRLIYPQWQGANISKLVPELKPEDASKGYILGSYLLNYLAPETSNKTLEVPISEEIKRIEENGILGYKQILEQTKDALNILKQANADKIVTLGGECSVSVVPFSYLAKKYNNDIVLIWIDAHPDITLPEDKTYNGYHAMAVTAIMGQGDKEIVSKLPATINPEMILFIGLRDWERQQIKDRQIKYGIKHLTAKDLKNDSSKVLDWIKLTGKKHVVIHFDLDVLDPAEIISAVGVAQDGMKIAEVTRVINDIAKEYDIVGLTIAEPMPRTAIQLKNMLQQLPLMK